MSKVRSWARLCLGWVGIMLLVGESQAAQPKGLILYFDPEGNHEAIKEIARLFNEYLEGKKADLIFQPVKDQQKLEALLGSEQVRYSIVSSDYLKRRADARLRPILIPLRRNSHFYTKVLVDSGQGRAGDLKGDHIMASYGGGLTSSAEILQMLKKSQVDVEGAQVTPVPNDVNAVRAVIYKLADAALVTQENIDTVLSLYVADSRPTLRKLFETPPIMRPPLCAVGPQSKKADEQVIALFVGMEKDALGKKVMSQLRIDSWSRYVPGMERTK